MSMGNAAPRARKTCVSVAWAKKDSARKRGEEGRLEVFFWLWQQQQLLPLLLPVQSVCVVGVHYA